MLCYWFGTIAECQDVKTCLYKSCLDKVNGGGRERKATSSKSKIATKNQGSFEDVKTLGTPPDHRTRSADNRSDGEEIHLVGDC